MGLEICVTELLGKITEAPTSVEPRIDKRTGKSSRRTGRIWSSVKSDLINSVNTCIAPCTESGELDRSRMSEDSSSGYSSGQSELAMEERVCACQRVST